MKTTTKMKPQLNNLSIRILLFSIRRLATEIQARNVILVFHLGIRIICCRVTGKGVGRRVVGGRSSEFSSDSLRNNLKNSQIKMNIFLEILNILIRNLKCNYFYY